MKRILLLMAAVIMAAPAYAQSKLNIVTTTEDLASIAREVAGDRERLPGSAFRRGEAEFHPEAPESGPADCGRPRARDRLAAAAHSAEPQRQDSAGRGRLSGCLARRD